MDDDGIMAVALQVLTEHGPEAASVAVLKLNDSIDRKDWHDRDMWARIVHAIHELQAAVCPDGDAGEAALGAVEAG